MGRLINSPTSKNIPRQQNFDTKVKEPFIFLLLKTWLIALVLENKHIKNFVYNQFKGAQMNNHNNHPSYLWDYDISKQDFQEILAGTRVLGRLDQDWAALRLLEYASYEEIIQLLGFTNLVKNWTRWRPFIRSKSRIRGFDFIVNWLPEKHPELCHD